jgi:hypothetical protein
MRRTRSGYIARSLRIRRGGLDRLVGIGETVFGQQILVDALRAQPGLNLCASSLLQRLTLALASAPLPAVEIARFNSSEPLLSDPAGELAGF